MKQMVAKAGQLAELPEEVELEECSRCHKEVRSDRMYEKIEGLLCGKCARQLEKWLLGKLQDSQKADA